MLKDASALMTPQFPWMILHPYTAVASFATAVIDLTAAGGGVIAKRTDASTAPTADVAGNAIGTWFDLRSFGRVGLNSITIAGFGKVNAGGIFGLEILAFRELGALGTFAYPLFRSSTNDCELGTQVCSVDTNWSVAGAVFVDTFGGSVASTFSNVAVKGSGSNFIAEITGDFRGFRYLWPRLINFSAGSNVTGVGLLISGY